MTNPLLEDLPLPPFSQIEANCALPAIEQIIAHNKTSITQLLKNPGDVSVAKLLTPLEELDDTLAKAWSPIGHLNGVLNSEALRDAYKDCLALLSEYGTWTGQHSELFAAYQKLAESGDIEDAATQMAINNSLRDFRLAGVDLPEAKRQRFGELRQRLSKLGAQFSENVMDATDNWRRLCNEEDLTGLPETALASARQAAQQLESRKGVPGEGDYLVTLEFPSYLAVMTYCENAELREQMYTAFSTRASNQGPHAGRWDNSPVIEEILNLRLEIAQLVGFANYAEYSLATKMAGSTDEVLEFLEKLAASSRSQANEEWAALEAFAAESLDIRTLQAWDVTFASEKMKQAMYQVSQEEIRPYLPVDRVLAGLFELVQRLYSIEIAELHDFDTYHADVRLFEVRQGNEPLARFYLDLYARANKRGGAWMDDCRVRRLRQQGLQIPVAYLVCNFTAPVGEQPSLLTTTELTTLFHEFGHGLHHMLTRQTVAAVSGINGVPWDAVELPSQFLENWCWEPEALAFISGHFETSEPLPDELLTRMLDARNFQSGMQMLRQLEFALFDFRLHRDWQDGVSDAQALLDSVRSEVAVVTPPSFNRFQHSFSHIFAGGYAAGYYSYKWAEVLSADAYSRFEEEGIFNATTGAAFRREVLEVGGARDAMESFIAFRGRKPEVTALLRHSGIAA
ncbi:M3 family metallopeptidase [Halioglobus pacificus]|uniref:oligopeptidase A n=1 Tax=Parahalioglobus pacificus TaxID=930806 RepID=A0A918XIW4_9GAMM|nr:M3 family metallopeptidase [Halioglobus pacificus]GHD32667.1 oligopeptidase A [Halioglobus pacificus]